MDSKKREIALDKTLIRIEALKRALSGELLRYDELLSEEVDYLGMRHSEAASALELFREKNHLLMSTEAVSR